MKISDFFSLLNSLVFNHQTCFCIYIPLAI